MPTVTPIGVVIMPFLLLALLSRRLAFYTVALSIPFKTLDVFVAVSHHFTLPEVAVVILIAHQFVAVLRHRRLSVGRVTTYGYLAGFALLGMVSVAYLFVRPADVSVHPYNVTSGFGAFELVPLAFSIDNVTQLLLRWFFVGSIAVIAYTLDRRSIRVVTRWVVVSTVLVGVLGLVYQLSFVFGDGSVADFFRMLGFRRFRDSPRFVGPLPRMYSVTGEPGETASYILYALALVSTFALSRPKNAVFTRREAIVASAVLSVLLGLTTGTTGYGGLVVFLGVLGVATLAFDDLPTRRTVGVFTSAVVLGIAALAAVAVILNVDVGSMVAYHAGKLQLQSASGSIRFRYLLHTLEIVTARPLLGLGVGSHNPTSLFGTVLVETGVLGLTLFVAFHARTFRDAAARADDRPERRSLGIALAVAGGTLFLTNLLARSSSSLLFPWYWFSIALPLAHVAESFRDR